MAFTTDARVHRYASYVEMETGSRVHRYGTRSQFATGARVHRYSQKAFTTGSRIHRYAAIQQFTTGARTHRYCADPPPTANSNGLSEWTWVKGGSYTSQPRSEHPSPTVTIRSSTGSMTELCPHTVILRGSENTTSTVDIALRDRLYQWHPYGSGDYNDRLTDGAEVDITVDWGGHDRTFSAIMKAPNISRQGDNPPEITWGGTGFSKTLFNAKKNLETLGSIGRSTGMTNKQILAEVCDLVGIEHSWGAINTTLVGGPYHRQQLQPGQVARQMLDLTLDSWTDEARQIVGYDPEKPRRNWYYTLGEDIVFSHDIQPEDNEVYDKVIVLRSVATGQLQSLGDDSAEVQVEAFGEYTVSLPHISAPMSRITHGGYPGFASDFRYTTPTGTYVRNPRATWPSDMSEIAPIRDATSVTFTWGAADEGVTRSGITSSKAGVAFYGIPTNNGTIGTGETAEGPLDLTTRRTAGDGDNELELAATPLLSGADAMDFLAEKTLRRLGKPHVQHVYRMPLNHLIRCGDYIEITKDAKLGGGSMGAFEVVAWEHRLAYGPLGRITTVTLREHRES